MWGKSPVQVQCMIQDAVGWCTGITQGAGMGREVGGRFRIGNTCTPVADSCLCMAKPIQYCKVKKNNKKKIKKRKKERSAQEGKTKQLFASWRKWGAISPVFGPHWLTLVCLLSKLDPWNMRTMLPLGCAWQCIFFFPKLGIATHFHGYGICLESFYSRKQQVDFCYFPGLK